MDAPNRKTSTQMSERALQLEPSPQREKGDKTMTTQHTPTKLLLDTLGDELIARYDRDGNWLLIDPRTTDILAVGHLDKMIRRYGLQEVLMPEEREVMP